MKFHYYISSIVITFSVIFSSCESFLDVNPDGQEKQEELLNTRDGIESAMYGVYSKLRESSLYGASMTFKHLDVMAQHFDCSGNDMYTQLGQYNYAHSDVKSIFEAIWTSMYNNISNVNAIINCDLVKNANSYPYTIYKGEALGLRAFMHFDLLRIFTEQITRNASASGIPYATEFSLNTPAFSTAADVYKFIIADLKEAELLLADEEDYADESNFMLDRKIHFNLHAVRASLARVYLTMGDMENAAKYASAVIKDSGRTLTEKINVEGDLAGVLSNSETIWGLYYAEFYSLVSPTLQQYQSRSSLNPRRDYTDIYNKNLDGLDFRLNAYFGSTGESVRFIKLTNIYELRGIASSKPSDLILGINMIRLPEMYYIMAEALLESDIELATDYFNAVIEHRGLTAINQRVNKLNLSLELIKDERYKEFWGEGQSFFNLKRTHSLISLPDGNSVQPSNSVFVVPIPDIEYDYRN